LCLFPKHKSQVIALSLLHIRFGEDRLFAEKRFPELFDQGIACRRLIEAQPKRFALRERDAFAPEQIVGKDQFGRLALCQLGSYLGEEIIRDEDWGMHEQCQSYRVSRSHRQGMLVYRIVRAPPQDTGTEIIARGKHGVAEHVDLPQRGIEQRERIGHDLKRWRARQWKLMQRGDNRQGFVTFDMEDGPEFSNDSHESVTTALQNAKTTLWSVVLQEGRGERMNGPEARERAIVLGDVTTASGGGNHAVLSRQAIPKGFAWVATMLTSQLDVTYARPDALIPPKKLEMDVTRKDVKLWAPRWGPQ